MERWVEFWCKKDTKYRQPSPRREKKFARLTSSHNPNGVIGESVNWSSAEEALFHKLEVKSHNKNETYLAAFLSCWLCVFVILTKEVGFIRPGVFRIACHLACGQRVSLVVPVLASIYKGLNTISRCSRLDLVQTYFPIHYVYGWLTYYFKTHYPLAGGPANPFMASFSGEGTTRYFEKEYARKRIHGGGTISWDATLIKTPNAHHYRDDGTEKEFQSNFFMSLSSNYLTLRDENIFIMESYSPHRFSRQFGFFQDAPDRLDQDFCEASLVEGLRLARICVLIKSRARAIFLPSGSNLKKFFSLNYKSWWEKVHENFLENYIQSLVSAVGLDSNILQKQDDEVLIVSQPTILKSKVVFPDKIKGSSLEEVQKEKYSAQIQWTSHKRPSQDESSSTRSDHCWKQLKLPSDTPNDDSSHPVEIFHNNVSSSKTLTAIKEANDVSMLDTSHQSKPQDSNESVEGPTSRKSILSPKLEREATFVPHERTTSNVEYPPHKKLTMSVSIFDGKQVISELRMNFVEGTWNKIHSKLADLTAERVSSLEDEVQVIFKDVNEMGVDISPLKNLLESLFVLATSYDQAQSSLADKALKIEESVSYLNAKKYLDLVLNKKNEKFKELSDICQSLKEARKKVKELNALRDAAKKEVEDVESKVSTAEQEYNRCVDVSLATANASNDVEDKKRVLEISLQDLTNYKLRLD
ncbi:uncharacterized protein LOC129893076 [Solanum dulcamara]|uniref:uncharacterized protein LOC129893076 n=1 Tax=Solanum dulcamara TaxID=45834 RepID=UPI0024858217|nr:uncharacterized protein LOC129893076 [Solanum dulcamara]